MNKVFKVIWNHATQSWVAVSELTSAKGKTKSKKLTALSVAVGSALVGTQALAAVYVNNQAVTTAGSGSRIVIATGESQTVANKINSTTGGAKYDKFIRIGDAGSPIVRDGDILIGFGINNQSTGEAGDTVIGNNARLGGGNLDSFSTGVGYRIQSAGPSVSIGVGARSDIGDNRAWNGTENGGVAIGAYALQAGNKDGGVAIGAVSGGDYNYITSVGALSGVGGYQIDQVQNVGYKVNGGNDGATSIGYRAGARGVNSVALGRQATTANSQGRNAISVGYETHSIGEASVALGTSAVAGGFSASEITALETEKARLEGILTNISTDLQSAIGNLNNNAGKVSTVEMKFRVGQLHSAKAKAEQELNRIKADLNRTSAISTQSVQSAIAIGNSARANNINATAIGRSAVASAANSIVLGRAAGVTGVNSTTGMAIGDAALISGDSAVDSIAVGHSANIKQNSSHAIAIGANASVVGDLNGSSGSIAIGHNTVAGNKNAEWRKNSSRELGYLAAQNATAVGTESVAGGTNSTTFGYKNVVHAPNSGALGFNNIVGNYSNPQYNNNVASANYNGTDSFVVGANNNVTANNTVVFGNNVTVNSQGTNRTGAVVFGDNSTVPTEVKAVNSAKIGTENGKKLVYSGFAGNLDGADTDGNPSKATADKQGRFVSVGNATSPRQVKFVAAGEISATSTDAINGSQLYAFSDVVNNLATSASTIIGGSSVLNSNGTISGFSQPLNITGLGNTEGYTAPTTPATNVSTAITNLNNYVNAGWKIAEGNEIAAKARISPNEQVNFKADGLATVSVAENATAGADVTYSVQKGIFDTTTNGTVKANPTKGVVTNTDVATAVNNSGWNTTTTGGTNVTVNPGDQVNYVNGNGTTANVTTKTVDGKDVVSVSYNVNQTKGSVNKDGTVAVVDGNSFLNASNVANLVNNASFNVSTKAVDKFAAQTTKTAQVKAGGNVTYIAGKNIAIEQDNQNFTFSTTKNVVFNNAQVNSTLTIGNGTSTNPKVNITSTTSGLVLANGSTSAPVAINNVQSFLPGTAGYTGTALNTDTATSVTAPTLTTENKARAATIDDVVNTGWNLRGQKAAGKEVEAVDFVKPYDTVVFKSGNNATTDVVTTTDADNKVSTITITAKAEPVKTSNLTTTVNNNGTISVATGEDGTNLVNATTVENAINASGWNTNVTNATTGLPETKVVTPGTQVDYVNGNGTTANVTLKDGKVAVSYNVNQTTGSVNTNGTAKVADGNSFLNASTVANLVNNASFSVTTAKVDAFAENQEGKANAAVKAGGNITYTAGKNIAISQNGSNFTFSTTKDVVFNNAQVNSTLTIGNGTATSPKVNIQSTTKGLDMGNAVLTNVSSGITPYAAGTTPVTTAKSGLADLANSTQTNVVTVADAAKLGWVVSTDKTTTDATTGTADGNVYAANVTTANEVKFVGKGYATVSGATDSNGVRTITVSVGNVGAGKINADGSVTETKAGLLTAEEGTKLINGAGWLTNVTNATTGATETKVVTPGTQVDYVNGNGTTANVTLKDGKVAVSYNVNQTTGSLNPNGTAKVADGDSFLNASTVANLVNNAAFNVTTAKVDAFAENQEGKANAAVKAGGNITYTAGKNIAISQNGSNFTFSTTKDIEVDSVTANNRVQIGSGDTAVNLTTDLGALQVADKDGNATQITNVEAGTNIMAFNKEGDQLVKVGDKYYVVNPETNEVDYDQESTLATEEELDELAKAKPALKAYVSYAKAASGLADLDNSEQTNALTVADAQRLGWVVSASGNDYADSVTNANEVRFNGVNGVSVTGNTTDGVRNINISLNTTTLTSNANGTTTVTNGNSYVNGTTVADAINKAGWNTTLSDGTTLNVNPGDQVNYVNGNGTTANVTKAKDANGNDVVSVSYNVNQTTGSVNPNGTATVTDGNAFLNASTVANLVNNAAFNVTTAKVDAFAENQEGKANAAVKAGGNITYTAGKNIAISQNGSNFTFSTTKDIEVDSVTANNRVQIGSGDTAVNLTTDLGALQVADKDGNATQITNVEAGTNVMAFNKEGDQLVQVGDKFYVVDPETNEVDFTKESTPATEEELDELAKAKPALKAYVAYSKAASGLADLDNSEQTNALTVADAQRLGWVVSASGNDYADSVTNANEVRFNGSNGISVTGETDEHGVRNINVSIAKGNVAGNTTTGVATGDTNYVTGDQVANAINNSGWKTTATKVVDEAGNEIVDANKATAVNPGDSVNYVDGNSTKANVVVTKAADGKETVNVSYDLVTEDHLTPVANDAKSVTKPTNIDAKGKDAATVNDVLNAGWNLQANDEAVDAVTHGNNVNFTSKDGSVKITAKSDGSTSSLDFAVNATSIVNQVAGTISYNKDGKATTNGDGKRIATVGDVANTINNTGWLTNVTDAKGNVTTKVVTPNTQVNYVNGDGTKANVVANSTTGGLDVTFNVKSANPETLTVDGNGVKVNTGSITEATDVAGDANRGKVTVAAGEGNKVATVQNVANAINSASWTVKVADTQEEITTSTANDEGSSVRAGNEITHVAGKNLKVKRDGRNVTYALANDVSVNTVTAQNSIKVGAGNAATTVTTSSAQDGVTEVKLADEAGKATRITNVAAGVKDTDAVNVSQLRNSNAQINQNIAHLNNKVNRMGKDLRAGIAGSNAAAGLPQVYIPGKSMVAAAAGTFKGQSAVAVGYSRASDNGKVILKLQGNANTRGDVGGSVGVGYQW